MTKAMKSLSSLKSANEAYNGVIFIIKIDGFIFVFLIVYVKELFLSLYVWHELQLAQTLFFFLQGV